MMFDFPPKELEDILMVWDDDFYFFKEHIEMDPYDKNRPKYFIVHQYDGSLFYCSYEGKTLSFQDIFEDLKSETKERLIFYLDVFS